MKTTPSALQFARFLLVGGFNTVFGYGLFAALNWAFTGRLPYGYLLATALANLIAITVAFLGYKWFVFRTQGNYLIEWLRCLGVYGSSMVVGLIGMAILVPILQRHMHNAAAASYIAAAILLVVSIVFSFLGHKNVSFRQVAGGRSSAAAKE